jgi:hypothetical protein
MTHVYSLDEDVFYRRLTDVIAWLTVVHRFVERDCVIILDTQSSTFDASIVPETFTELIETLRADRPTGGAVGDPAGSLGHRSDFLVGTVDTACEVLHGGDLLSAVAVSTGRLRPASAMPGIHDLRDVGSVEESE